MSSHANEFRTLYRQRRIAHQRQFFEERRNEYDAAERQASLVRNVLLVAASLAGMAGQLSAGTARAGWAVGAVALAALAGAVTAFEALIGFPQLKKLYSDAALGLGAAEIDWSSTTELPNGLVEEIERVENILRTENGQWGQLVLEGSAKASQDAGFSPGAPDAPDRGGTPPEDTTPPQ